jgi:4-amino-4-deoxy-L-arabinose transferase-like glycosyltransferase
VTGGGQDARDGRGAGVPAPPAEGAEHDAPADREDWFPRWLGPGAVVCVFLGLAWWSWGKWTDVQIDFGNELYIAWRLSTGEALYLDIAHRNGPFSHYANALWFQLFGASLRTLIYCNLAVLAGICAMTWRVFRVSCGRFTATATVLVLLSVFAFSQYVGVANYNYVTPYHHFQTHGLALSIAMILCFGEALRRTSLGWCAGAGVCAGLVFLTKAELFVPVFAVAVLGLGLMAAEVRETRRATRAVAVFAIAAAVPVVAFLLLLVTQMPASLALEGVLGNWARLEGGLLRDRFYAVGAGIDDVAGNLWIALRMFAALAGFAGFAWGADRWLPRFRGRAVAAAAAGLALFAALVALPEAVPWRQLARALPLTTLTIGLGLGVIGVRRRWGRAALARWAPLLLWALLGLGLLGKMILRARFHHYGFVLAMPATLLLVAGLLHLVPASLAGGRGALARALGLAAVAAGAVVMLGQSAERYARKDFPVGEGGDRIVAENSRVSRRPQRIAEALARLEGLMPADATLLVLPEGIGLNYWLRRINPTRYNLFLPTELRAFGGDAAMLEEIRAHPPDFVVLMDRDHREFGVGPFGVDPRNGRRLVEWVDEHYRRVARIGPEPFRSRGFGIVILRRAETGAG